MSQILNQDEVDALLSGISRGDVPTGTDEPADVSEIVGYDLTSQDRIVRGRMPALEIINEGFARLFRTSLSTKLRKVVDMTACATEIFKFGEFLKTLYVPTSIQVFRLEPIRGHVLMVLESNLVFTLIDAFLGGKGAMGINIDGRDFTNIETRMIRKVVDTALADYERAWKPVYPVSVRFLRSEMNPQFVGIVPATDLVVTTSIEVEMGTSAGKLIVCIPYGSLEPIKNALQAGFQSDRLEVDLAWMERFRKRLIETPVDIRAELGRTRITGKELISLEKGDVLMLDRYSADELDVRVEGVLKLRGYPGVYKGSHAVKISSVVAGRT